MNTKRYILPTLSTLAVIVGLVIYANRHAIVGMFFEPTDSTAPSIDIDKSAIKTVSSNLETPWSISILPGGDLLLSERSGQLERVGESGATYPIANVRETSEGGLLGIALHPDFNNNNQLYLYYTTQQSGTLTNQIDVATLDDDRLSQQRTILAGIPAAANHNGGAIEFGPDGKLYITTGDASNERLAQDTASLAGKILRINDDGSTPEDNPFSNLIWSYGHRNPQGIAWDEQGRLWSVEHGPSGTETGRDELNLIEKGANYGWPDITGDETRSGMKTPVLHSGVAETWAPARMAYADGKLYFTGLRGQSLYGVDISSSKPTLVRYLSNQYGRLRAITSHESTLYIGTSNRDGRGAPTESDDRIMSVPLTLLSND